MDDVCEYAVPSKVLRCLIECLDLFNEEPRECSLDLKGPSDYITDELNAYMQCGIIVGQLYEIIALPSPKDYSERIRNEKLYRKLYKDCKGKTKIFMEPNDIFKISNVYFDEQKCECKKCTKNFAMIREFKERNELDELANIWHE